MNVAAQTEGALAGIRIIDMTHEWAGPHCARLMADFGAEVIKVEYLPRLDHMRGARKDEQAYNKQTRFLQLNRNKRSVSLNLRESEDRESFAELVRQSDVLISNSRPGVLKRLGFAYEDLCALKPDIILMSLSACGQTGPEAGYAGYGGGLEAVCGVQSLTGYNSGEEPKRIREMDVTNGIMASSALMTALLQRQFTGRGTWVDLSEVEAPIHSLIGEFILEKTVNGHVAPPAGNRDPQAESLQGCYPCRGEDAWVSISIGSESAWRAFCEASGHSAWLSDPRFLGKARRMQHHDELDALIENWTRTLDAMQISTTLQKAGVSAGPVMNAGDLVGDPHLHERGFFQQLDETRYPGFPFRLSGGGESIRHPGPELGEGNRQVIGELLRRPSAVRPIREEDIRTDFDID